MEKFASILKFFKYLWIIFELFLNFSDLWRNLAKFGEIWRKFGGILEKFGGNL